MTQSEDFRYPVIPVQVLGVDAEEVTAGQRPAWRVEYVEALMYKLTQFAKTLVNGPNIGRLLG